MSEIKSGFAFHCHHNVLYEYVYDYDASVKYIKEFKPVNEQELSLRLFKMIPADKLPQGLLEAFETYNKALIAYYEAEAAYDEAEAAYYEAGAAWDANKLHEELCLDCPWDGATIFSKELK